MVKAVVAVLATLDTKNDEAQFVCNTLSEAGVTSWLVDLSLRPHATPGADIDGGSIATAAQSSWNEITTLDRAGAAEVMVLGGQRMLLDALKREELSGVIGLGGANGTSIVCAIMRALPPLLPKVMVSPVAATAAVQWYVAESDIAMFSSIGDISMNRITRAVLRNAAEAVAAMARRWTDSKKTADQLAPLVGVSTFGVTEKCVSRVTEGLAARGMEVIQFHASGPGGKALESLAGRGELAGVVDVTTHELADLVVGGVYSAGDGRLRSAGQASLPQIIVPGALDFANFWVGSVPEKFSNREFLQFNTQNILMRTNADELSILGRLVAGRLNDAAGPFVVLIPTQGFSENTKKMTHSLDGREIGTWARPDVDRAFTDSLREHLKNGRIEELDLHINDAGFADTCIAAFLELIKDADWPDPSENAKHGE
jgi:uncharacterized protein (UPF0261 family)